MWAFMGWALVIAIGGGLALGVALVVPMSVYTLPYMTWLYWNRGSKGIPKDLPSEKNKGLKFFTHNTKNATKLYRSWITHKPHNITDW